MLRRRRYLFERHARRGFLLCQFVRLLLLQLARSGLLRSAGWCVLSAARKNEQRKKKGGVFHVQA
jgi:hypothetical protein